MMRNSFHAAALAAVAVAAMSLAARAQTEPVDPHHPDATVAQAETPALPDAAAGADTVGQPGGAMQGGSMMGGMMQPGMMQPGMMGGMPMMVMRGHMMKMMFAIADADGDDALSFEEIAAVHQRIFNKVDADKDGKVTREEVQSFMQD